MTLEQNLLGSLINQSEQKAANLITGYPQQQPNVNRVVTGGLQRFISKLNSSQGLAKPTLFEVTLLNLTTNTQDLSFLCHQASIPGFRQETARTTIYSLPYETPVGIEFDPFWCTFYIDNTFTANNTVWQSLSTKRMNTANWSPKYRNDPNNGGNLFEVWVAAFNPSTANPAGVTQQTSDGLPLTALYRLKNAFFKTVQQTPLDWSAHNDVMSVTVEILYEWFEVQYPQSGISVYSPESVLNGSNNPMNFSTVLSQYPALASAYDITKNATLSAISRTVLQNQNIQGNPFLNQASQFIPF